MSETFQRGHDGVVWVAKDSVGLIRPQCEHACVAMKCDSGHTVFGQCDPRDSQCVSLDMRPTDTAGSEDGARCFWSTPTVAKQPCRKDPLWRNVVSCTDPTLPIASFSVMSHQGLQVACGGSGGVRECTGVDVSMLESDTLFFEDIMAKLQRAGGKPELLSVGSYVGIVGFVLSKTYPVHLFEPVPSTRQWLKVTRCLERSTASVYDFGVGEYNEECSAPPTNGAAEGEVHFKCPAALADDSRYDTVVPFRNLDFVYNDWKWDVRQGHTSRHATNKANSFVLWLDDAVDPLPILRGGARWFRDRLWRPAVIVLTVKLADEAALLGLMAASEDTEAKVTDNGPAHRPATEEPIREVKKIFFSRDVPREV